MVELRHDRNSINRETNTRCLKTVSKFSVPQHRREVEEVMRQFKIRSYDYRNLAKKQTKVTSDLLPAKGGDLDEVVSQFPS
mmetsp:Transcript_24278/g.37450  ORF Transcript_24278/g.37450 Transcript_24278/m.37450 type:complete len:81 (+) Transcript_24278:329-571(+)